MCFRVICALMMGVSISCADSPPVGPAVFEAEEGSGAMVPSPDVPNPPADPPPDGALLVAGVVVEGTKVRAFVTNTTAAAEKVHLCTFDCSETYDCETALQTLHRDKRKVLEPNTGAHFRAEVPCYWQWNILREDDPREMIPMTCPDTYRWGEGYPGLEFLDFGVGHRRCDLS